MPADRVLQQCLRPGDRFYYQEEEEVMLWKADSLWRDQRRALIMCILTQHAERVDEDLPPV